MNKVLVILLIGIFMISSVFALGVTPARTTLDFEPGLSRSVGFEILNSGNEDMKVVFSAQGELAEYISLDVDEASILAAENSKSFSYNLNLPSELTPGLHTGEVFAMQLPSGPTSEGSQILATLAVVTQVYVYVPYPGKYASSKMYVYNANQGEDVAFVFPVTSQGEFDLTAVRASVDIYNKLNEKVASFATDSIAVPSGTRKELAYKWKADVPIGDYLAKASLIYDDGTLNFEETFSVGSEDLVLKEINVGGFSLGEIAKLEMLVENKWSEPISDAHVETKIMNDRGDIVSSFESATYDVEPLSKKVFVSYWDTAGVRVGTYETEVAVVYGEKSSVKALQFDVEEDKLTVIGLGYVISAEGDDSNTLMFVLIGVIILLVLVNLLWFFMFRKRFK
jgi:hypothetical protein